MLGESLAILAALTLGLALFPNALLDAIKAGM